MSIFFEIDPSFYNVSIPSAIDLSFYQVLLKKGFTNIEKKDRSKAIAIAIYVLGKYAPYALSPKDCAPSSKILRERMHLLEELKENLGKRNNGPHLQSWYIDKKSLFSTEKPKQAIKAERWMAGSLFSFPFQQTHLFSSKGFGIGEHEKTQVQGIVLLKAFVDNNKRGLSSKELCLLQRTLWVYGGIVENRKKVSFWQLLVDWAQDDKERKKVVDELRSLFSEIFPKFKLPRINKSESRSAQLAITFQDYITKRVLRTLSRELGNVQFSQDAKKELLHGLATSTQCFIDVAYFSCCKEPISLLPDRSSNPILSSIYHFQIFSLNLSSEKKTSLFDLILFRNLTLEKTFPFYGCAFLNRPLNPRLFSQALDQLEQSRFQYAYIRDKDLFYLLLFFVTFKNDSQIPLFDLTIQEILLFAQAGYLDEKFYSEFKNFSVKDKHDFCHNLLQGCVFREDQGAFLYSLQEEKIFKQSLIVLKSYYNTLDVPMDSEFCFHFLMSQIDGEDILKLIEDEENPIEIIQRMNALCSSLPEHLQPLIDFGFPYQEISREYRGLPIVSQTEKTLLSGVEALFEGNEKSYEAKRVLAKHNALIEKGIAISYQQIFSESQGSLQEELIKRTMCSLEAKLDLKFSPSVYQSLAESMKSEKLRLDLAYHLHFETSLTKLVQDSERDPSNWRDRFQYFITLQKECCASPEERSLLFDYIFLCRDELTLISPYKYFHPNSLSSPLPPLSSALEKLFSLKEKMQGGEYLVGVYLRNPDLLSQVSQWPIESLQIDQLLLICADQGRVERCQQKTPDFGFCFTQEQRGFLYALSDQKDFQERLDLLKKLPQEGISSFAFAYLMSTMRVKSEKIQDFVAAVEKRNPSEAVQAFLEYGRDYEVNVVLPLFMQYIKDLDQS